MPIPYEESFASHEKSKYWSSINNIKPESVLKKSHKQIYFNCNICSHEFKILLYRIELENAWCPYCSNKLCNDENCKICFENSFASQPMSELWSSENKITPRHVRKSSGKKFIFKCKDCKHNYSSALNNIKKGVKCPYCCVNSVTMCYSEECNICFNKSFASSPMSKYWSSKNTISPRNIFKKTDKKYLFNCIDCNNDFLKRPLCIAYGGWCPYCKNKTETKLYTWLVNKYKTIKYQPKYEWCKNPKTNRMLPFDFEYKDIIIELDGPQHFKQISNWRTPQEQNEIDRFKMDFAIKNNKHIIRISQKYVYMNNSGWEQELEQTIDYLSNLDKSTYIIRYIKVDPMYFE